MEGSKFDINNIRSFKTWRENTLITLGGKDFCMGMSTALKKGHVDEEAMKCGIPVAWTWVAPGTLYRGELRVNGLTGTECLTLWPIVGIPNAVLTAAREKFRSDYVGKAARCMSWMMSLLSDNTRRFLANVPKYKRADEEGDLVLFMHILDEKGRIGTGTKVKRFRRIFRSRNG